MTQNVAGWLPALLGPVVLQVAGVPQPSRGNVNFAGGTASDNAVTDTLTITPSGNPTTLAGDGGGFANVTGNLRNTSNAKVVATQFQINTTVGAASATVIGTYATASGKTYSVRGIVAVANSPGSAYGEWEINCYVVNNTGVLTLAGTPVTQKVNVTGFVVTFTVSGTNLVLTVTDPTGARRWTGEIYIAERSF